MQKITTFLTFNDQAEEAASLYTSIFPDSKVTQVTRRGNGIATTVAFELAGQKYIALNGGPHFSFSTGISLAVSCANQAEIDYFWEQLTAGGGQPGQCGWLKDRFGVSWQILPATMPQLLRSDDPARAQRKMSALLQMHKIEIGALEEA